jgi:hypothetical protein
MVDGRALAALTNIGVGRFKQLCQTAVAYPLTSS